MRSFKYYLTEDKSRFIKKNKNLSRDQKRTIIDFFDKNEQAVKRNHKTKIDWNKSSDMKWNDFEKIMTIIKNSPSALKAKARKLRHKGITGLKEGVDYVTVKTKNKSFLCYIPLHYKANQVIFSAHIGGVVHDGCIGSSSAQQYYKSEAVRKSYVPIVVIGASKDTVMVKRDNKSWELWDSCNNRNSNGSRPFVNKELIPGFNIKKELMTNKLAGLYDWVRGEIWGKTNVGGAYDEEEYDDAVDAYVSLGSAIENYIERYKDAEEYGRDQVFSIINDTIEKYREQAEEIMSDFEEEYTASKTGLTVKEKEASDRITNRVKEIRMVMALEPRGTDVNDKGEPVWHLSGVEGKAVHNKRNINQRGKNSDRAMRVAQMELGGSNLVPYTKSELESFLSYAEKNYTKSSKDISLDVEEWDEKEREARIEAEDYTEIADNLDKLMSDGEWYEVYDENRNGNDWLDEVDWTDYIPSSEHDWTDDIYSPHLQSEEYSAYFTFNEEHGTGENIGEDYHLEDSIREEVYNGSNNVSGVGILADNDYPHPEDMDLEQNNG